METLKHFKNFCDEILLSNSRNYKIGVLTKYKDDDIIKFYLNYIYNPYITTGISDKKFGKTLKISSTDGTQFKSIFELLNWLKENNTGTDRVISQIYGFMTHNIHSEKEKAIEYAALFKKIVIKDLQLGVEILTINKVMSGLIPSFSVQLANKYFDNPQYVVGKEFTLTTKIDGGRIVALKENGQVHLYTRAGQLYEGLVDIEEELESLDYDNFALDGEITLVNHYKNGKKLTSKEQYKETMMITRRKGEKHGVKILAFDVMPIDDFKKQNSTLIYIDRRATLEEKFKDLTFVTVLPSLYSGSDVNMISSILKEQVNNNEEGIMININNAYYEFKRTNSLLKCKLMKDLDLTITGVEEGSGQNAGKLGALLVEYKGFTVKVGSGISQELREKIWKNPDEYIGLTAIVQYFEETTNQEGGISLRFPVLIDIRTDK